MTKTKPTFNLIDEPWIPVTTGARTELVSIAGAFAMADELGSITGDVPTQTLSMYRLLGAILHASLKPVSDPVGVWGALWDGSTSLADVALPYLRRPEIHERFNLIDSDQPFYQMPGMEISKVEARTGTMLLSTLVSDLPSGTSSLSHFSNRTAASVARMPFAEAARWVVNVQSADVGGIKTPMVGQDRVQKGKIYSYGNCTGWLLQAGCFIVEGASLRETLALNLVLANPATGELASGPDDKPAWEKPFVGAFFQKADTERTPDGPLDLLTWQQRRVRLFHDGESVSAAALTHGDPVSLPWELNGYEPNTAWTGQAKTKKGVTETRHWPRKHDHGSALNLWGGLPEQIISAGPGTTGSRSTYRPLVLDWLGFLQTEGALDRRHTLCVRALGDMLNDKASFIESDFDETVSFAAAVVSSRGVAAAQMILTAYREASSGLFALRRFAYEVSVADGGPYIKTESGAMKSAAMKPNVIAAVGGLERQFRVWVEKLPVDVTEDDLQEWRVAARAVISGAAESILASTSARATLTGRVIIAGGGAEKKHYRAAESHLAFIRQIEREMPRIDTSDANPEKGTQVDQPQ